MIKILNYDGNFVYISASTVEATRLGASYIQSKKVWKVPISILSVRELMEYDTNDLLYELLNLLIEYNANVRTIKAREDFDGDPRLRNYQRVDVEFLKLRNNAGVFNEQRTGKTPTTLLALKDRMNKGLIVCPAGLRLNWKNEVRKWLDRDTLVVHGNLKQREELYKQFRESSNAILIVSYETLRVDLEKLFVYARSYDALIVDEAHRLRNYQTQQSKAVYKMGDRAKYVFALTGTPAVNHPSDVYGILKLLNPTKYSSYWTFVDRYFSVRDGQFGKEVLALREDRKAEFNMMLDSLSVQRKRKDVMKWIPKITETTIELERSLLFTKHYEKALKDFYYGEDGKERDIPSVLAQLTRLRQLCVAPSLLGVDVPSEKTNFIKDYVSDNTDSKVIVFSSFTSYLKSVAPQFLSSVLLTGEESLEEKQRAVDAFQNGTKRIMFANIQAGGVGWTLDKADTIIFVNQSYNPMDNAQAADRFVPTSELETYGAKEIIYLEMEDSIETVIHKLLDHKIHIIDYVNEYVKHGTVGLFGKELI